MTIDKNTESEFINNGFVIPYPDDPFEMKSGPFLSWRPRWKNNRINSGRPQSM